MPGWGRAVSRASPILSNPAPSWSVSITVGRRLGKLLGRADRFSPGDSVQAPSTSPRQFNLIDRTLNHVTLVLKINGVDQTTENQAGGGLFFFFSPPGVSFNSAKAVRARATGNTENVTLNWGVYHFSSPFPLYPGQSASVGTTPSLISDEAGDEAVLGRSDSSGPAFYTLPLAAELVRHFG